MKYVFYVSILVIMASAIAAFTLVGDDELSEIDCAIKINDKMISKVDFEKLYAHRSYHMNDKKEFAQNLITKELFIQEAQKLNLHQEDQFRLSVQSFYEQSLIRVLMDRKAKSLKAEVAESLIDRFIQLHDEKIDFVIYEFDSLDKALKKEAYTLKEESQGEPFRHLSMDIRYLISVTNEGEFSKPVLSTTDVIQGRYMVIHVIKCSEIQNRKSVKRNRDAIREKLEDYQKQQMITDWITEMKTTADVKIFAKLK
ncbi:MAG: hypothetical protein HN945_05850 [Deltaproteobacteria bacterium]|nr:hypothetical protein [Deltaproteobacteria bacterium]MBT7151957.1 hypothetical protein [Deltaproteobacteria bacterium]MBT7711252.1 hypothetical protein [Deltaproteobacteria bacterium]